MKILVADDDENSLVLLQRTLSSQGYEVDTAEDGKVALGKALASPPDLIISDILMPEMDGFEFCRRVKADQRLHTIPFIFYTATYVEQQDERLALSLGASRFLVKPIEPDVFVQIILETIDEYQGGLPLPAHPLEEPAVIERMHSEVLGRKLDKKVRELQAAVARAQASEEHLRLALEAGSMGVWDWGYASGTMTWSAGTARIFGLAPGDFDGTFATFLGLVHPDDRPQLQQLLEEAGARHQHFTHEFRVGPRDGSVRWVAAQGEFAYEARLPARMRGVFMDITERKQAEATLLEAERSRARLAHALTSEISHRTKNNLAIVAGLLQLQLDREAIPDAHAELIRDAIIRIMAFATLHEQMYQRHSDDIELLEALRRIAEVSRQALASEATTISVEGEPVVYPAQVATNLCVVANELITNALRHSGSPEGARQVEVRLRREGGRLVLTVWSAGRPVAADFDVRLRSRTGLGLVQSIVTEQYGGALRLVPDRNGTMAQVVLDEAELLKQ